MGSYRSGIRLSASLEVINLARDFLSDQQTVIDSKDQTTTRSTEGVLLLPTGPLDAKLTWVEHEDSRHERLRLWVHDEFVGNHLVAPEYNVAVNGDGKFLIAHGHEDVGRLLGVEEIATQRQIDDAYLTVIGGLMIYQCN